MRTLPPTVLLGLLLAAVPSPSPAQDIDTGPATPGSGSFMGSMRPPASFRWGNGHVTRAYGQTFTVTAGWTELNEFAFWLRDWAPNDPDPYFRAYLMAWNPVASRPQGEFLWQSERRQGPGSREDYVRYGFQTGGVTLDPASMYVAFLSTHDDILTLLPYGRSELMEAAGSGIGAYAGGTSVGAEFFLDPTAGFGPAAVARSYWSVNRWEDARFTADLGPTPNSTVPEPASMALLGSGLAGLAAWRRRRRPREA